MERPGSFSGSGSGSTASSSQSFEALSSRERMSEEKDEDDNMEEMDDLDDDYELIGSEGCTTPAYGDEQGEARKASFRQLPVQCSVRRYAFKYHRSSAVTVFK